MFRRQGERKICPGCVEEEDLAYGRLCDWLRAHAGASLAEAAAATGTDEAMAARLLRDGRVTLMDLVRPEDRPRCRSCDTPITGGQMCPACARTLGDALTVRPSDA
jgi:hypothetical protein